MVKSLNDSKLPKNIQNWIEIQSTLLIVMMVITSVSGFIMLIIRSKLPYLWSSFDKFISGYSELVLLFFALSSLFFLICYYQLLERKKYVYYFEFTSLILTVVFIFPIKFVLTNLEKIRESEIQEFYLVKTTLQKDEPLSK